jgi:hypothetical protein
MRVRFVVPRRRGRAGLRRLAPVALAAVCLAAGCGDSGDAGRDQEAGDDSAGAPVTTAAEPGRKLAIGITEQNPNFIWAPGHDLPEPFNRWRDELGKMHPDLYRMIVYWPSVQPTENAEPKLDAEGSGCSRDVGPCLPYAGIRDTLKALASRQKDGGWEVLVVIAGTPEWAAREPGGCEREGTEPTSRSPKPEAMDGYRKVVETVLAAAREEGVELRFWTPWNEPNHPFSLSPQREECSTSAEPAAAEPYARMGETLKSALDAEPGDQRLVLGELAALDRRKTESTTIKQFIGGLPRELVCATTIWSQHGYIGGRDPVDDVLAALDEKQCAKPHAIWMTETGVGAARRMSERKRNEKAEQRSCRRLHRELTEWYEDERVTAAFQYTFREDDIFPTGLVTADLTSAYPALHEWQAWGMEARPKPEDPPPASDSCGG